MITDNGTFKREKQNSRAVLSIQNFYTINVKPGLCGSTFLTFIKISISGSGLMFASFSLLDNSANISANSYHKYEWI